VPVAAGNAASVTFASCRGRVVGSHPAGDPRPEEHAPDTLATVRALIVTNMYPTPERPALGSFVRDQVEALGKIEDVELELYAFGPGSPASYLRHATELRRRYRGRRFDVVHAHFGLTAWPALAVSARRRAVTLHGTDLAHPRSRAITVAALPFLDLVATVSAPMAAQVPDWAVRGRRAVLPCGVDLGRFVSIPRDQARAALGLDPAGRYLLFPADPSRPEKRYDLALAAAGGTRLLTLGGVDPERVPLWVNAANAVLTPSDREGFGLALLEALACDVPVVSTPVGIAPEALDGVAGTYCGPFDQDRWREVLQPHLTDPDPRIAGRPRAERFSTDRLAADVVAAWRALLASDGA
jgi:teichuronic acid biosynthesis glycosyltransferase TuaC